MLMSHVKYTVTVNYPEERDDRSRWFRIISRIVTVVTDFNKIY